MQILTKSQLAGLIAAALAQATLPPTTPYQASILAAPVVGTPLNFVPVGLPNGVTVTSQQWRMNAGTGPAAVSSNGTSASYVPTSADIGKWPSVYFTTSDGGTGTSQEFAALNQVMSQTGSLTTPSPAAGSTYLTTGNGTVTLHTVSRVRLYYGTSYIETIAAPGTYPGNGATTFGDPTTFGATRFSADIVISQSYCCPAVVAGAADSAPATAERPSASTGVGFFTANGALYDANGNKAVLRGFNRCHWDANSVGAGSVGLFNAKANAQRMFFDMEQPWATNKALIDAMIANKVIPIICYPQAGCTFIGSIAGNTLEVETVLSGTIGTGAAVTGGVGTHLTATGVASGTAILAQITNTNANGTAGKEGTYTTSGAPQTTVSEQMHYVTATTGNASAAVLLACTQTLVDQAASLKPYERYIIINPTNEWGATGTSSDTTWRDNNAQAIAMLRGANLLCSVMIDAPGSGQDSGVNGRAWTLLNHGTYLVTHDSQQNVMLSLHVYGSYQAGVFAATAASLRSLMNTGVSVVIGEFGPALETTIPGSVTTAEALETVGTAEGFAIPWLAWAWDDSASSTDNHSYALCKLAGSYTAGGGGYQTSDPAELTLYGQQILPILAAQAVAATVFS